MPRTCAFLTMENPEGFFIYDHLAFKPLRDLDWDVIEVPWSLSTTQWTDFDAAVIRSTWDYQKTPESFLAILLAIEQSGTRLFNPLRVCRWNLNKLYLKDLQQRGVPIVPTQWMKGLSDTRLASLFDTSISSRLVVKPTIGANADGIFVLSPNEVEQSDRVMAEYATRPFMVQPFLKSIQTIGEFSLFYFGGCYSHAILKQPKAGDFRVQEEHGGIIRSIAPSEQIEHTARLALNAVGETLLYARVDIVLLDNGSPVVAELELIEPSLYFPYDSKSPQRFAGTLNEMWTQCSSC